MRKILLATTALAAFAGFSSAANAQVTVTLGGYTEFFGAIYDNNLVNGAEREFQVEAEIVVKADGKADNGLLYGTKIELHHRHRRQRCEQHRRDYRRSAVYIAGFWGRVELGDFDGAADKLAIYAPLVGVESIDGDDVDFIANTDAATASRSKWAVSPGAGCHQDAGQQRCDQDHLSHPALRWLPGGLQLRSGKR